MTTFMPRLSFCDGRIWGKPPGSTSRGFVLEENVTSVAGRGWRYIGVHKILAGVEQGRPQLCG